MNSLLLDPAAWQRIAPYFDRALDQPRGDREAWLAALIQTEPTIASTVRVLLAEYDALTSSGFLEQSPLAAFNFASMTGKRVGAYTIDSLLGRGGMGEVWLASRHDGRFEGRCAIKLLDDTPAKANLTDRFRREAHLLARLAHPHIARLIDAGSTEDGRQYLALEYVHGERIDHYCQAKGLSVEARVRLFLDVISAVAHAHANLIIHRDLKPSNVLVARDGQVKLLDFGIAKLLRDEPVEEDDSAETRVEEIALTPDYAAPEQILGDAPSTATDVYQLGMLLYVLLTGGLPLSSASRRPDLAKVALGGELPRASELTSGPLQKALRGDLDAILSMALRKNREDRYPTAAALGDDLRRYLNDEPVSARNGGALYLTRKFVRRHRLAVLGTALAAASLCATLVFALEQGREAARQRDQARFEARRADAQNRFMSLTMSAIGEPDKALTPAQMLENGVKLLDSRHDDDPDFVVAMLMQIASRYMDLGDREHEYAMLTRAEGIARRQRDPLALARVQCTTVEPEIARGHIDRAAARLAEGEAALARAPDRTLGDEIDCLHARASLSHAQGKTADAIRVIEQAVARLEKEGADHDDRYTWLVSHLSTLYGLVGDTRKGFEAVRKHRMAEQRKYGTDTVGMLAAMHNEACALRDLGEIRAAFAEETQVLKRAGTRTYPTGVHQLVSGTYADLLIRLDQPQAALSWFAQSIATATRAGDKGSISLAYMGRARALHALQRDAQANAEIDAAERVAESHAQPGQGGNPRSVMIRAQLLAARGDLDEARARAEPLLATLRDTNYGRGQILDDALLTASRIAAAQGRLAEAESYAREALRLDESRARDSAQSADVGEAALVLAQIRLQLNDRNGAHALASRAAVSLRNGLGTGHSLTRAALTLARESGQPRAP